MDVPELLERAAALVPPTVATEAGAKVADAHDYLRHREWEIALDILAELHEGWPVTAAYWDLLVEAADLMWLHDAAAWCRWGRWESVHGVIRADLRLLPAAEGGRRSALPGKGVPRPLWNVGGVHLVARVWVEHRPELAPGATGSVRLAPQAPEAWRDLRPGQTVTMHEGTPVLGTATITRVTSAG